MAFSSKGENFILYPTAASEQILAALRIKQRVRVIRKESEVIITTDSDQEELLGSLPQDALSDYPIQVQFEGYIRSISKAPDQSIQTVYVTILPKRRERDLGKVPRWEMETMEEGWLLKEQHYELLVANEDIRSKLRNPELQRMLKAVDSAAVKETALHEAYEGTEAMKSFIEEVLVILGSTAKP